MKKLISMILCITMLTMLLLSMTGCSLSNDYARITDMDYRAVVVDEPGSEGKIIVTERITFDVHAASIYNGFWELWRDLCEDWVDGVKVHYKVNSVKQILPDGTEVEWPESPQLYWEDYDYTSSRLGPGKWYHSEGPYNEYLAQYECVFFYVDNLYREEITFEIEYEMYNAVLRYNDCADLYIAMYSGNTTRYLESFNAEILIPEKDMPRLGCYVATTYGTNAGSFPIEESTTKNPGYHTFSFSLDEEDLKFKPYNEYIEFDLVSYGADKHAFAEYASQNDYYYDDVLAEVWAEQNEYANAGKEAATLKVTLLIICLIIAAVVLLSGRRLLTEQKRLCSFYDTDSVSASYREVPGDLDPKFAAALVFCKDTDKEKKKKSDAGPYSALLLSLARKGYVELQDLVGGDVLIRLIRPKQPIVDDPNSNYVEAYSSGYGYNSSYAPAESPNYNPQYSPGYGTRYDYEYGASYGTNYDEPVKEQAPESDYSYGLSQYADTGDNGDTFAPAAPQEEPEEHSQLSQYFTSPSAPIDAPVYAAREAGQPIVVPDNDSTQPVPQVKSMFSFLEQVEPVRAVSATHVSEVVDEREPLTTCEEYYWELLERHAVDDALSMTYLQDCIESDYDYTRVFANKIDNSVVLCGVNEGYFQKANWEEPKRKMSATGTGMLIWGTIIALSNLLTRLTRLDFVFGGLFILALVCVLTGYYLKKEAHKYVLLTEYGEGEYRRWRGLYNFLNSDTLIHEKTYIELPLWEKYLVYATAFDISEKVVSAIKIHCLEARTETSRPSFVHTSYCRSGRIRLSGNKFHSSVRRGRTYGGSHGGGGFGGGGFGYGGGGRGGGGGGGGH